MENGELIGLLEAHDPVGHADIVHLLSKGPCEVLYADRDLGVAVKHPCGTVYAAPFTSDVMPMIEAIGTEQSLINAESREMSDWYRNTRGWKFHEECILFRYDVKRGFRDEGPYKYRCFGPEEWPIVRKHYGFGTDEVIKEYVGRGDVFSIEDGKGTVMGFAGFHPEGSMGLLEIFPEWRRRGLGTYMENFIINEAMRRGMTPFCNVYISNTPSMNLQALIGMERGATVSYWIWPESGGW